MLVQVGLFTRELEPGAAPTDVQRVLAKPLPGTSRSCTFTTCTPRKRSTTASCRPRHAMAPTISTSWCSAATNRLLIVSRYDNLGKGAAGAAVQNLNLMLGLPETTGLADEQGRP